MVNGDIDDVLTGIDNALENVSEAQSSLGAKENALVSELEGLSVKKEAALATRSRVVDADFASEASKAIKSYILKSGAASISQQSSESAKLALNLLPLL